MKIKTLKIIIYVLFTILLVITLIYFGVIVKLLLFSVMLAYVLHPISALLVKKGMNRKVAAIVVLTLSSSAVLFFIFVIIPGMMIDLLQSLSRIKTLDDHISSLKLFLNHSDTSPFVAEFVRNSSVRLEKWSILMLNGTIKQLGDLLMVIPTYILAPVFVYYFLVEPDWFVSFFARFIPFQFREKASELIKMIDKIVGGFIRSQVVLGIVVGILTYIVLVLFHVKYPFIIAVVNGIVNIIPYFGPIIGIIPALFAALSDSVSKAVVVTLLLLLVQQFESNIISPKLVGDSIDMHPVFVMVLLLAGGELFGFWGLVFSIPIGAALRVTWKYAFRNMF